MSENEVKIKLRDICPYCNQSRSDRDILTAQLATAKEALGKIRDLLNKPVQGVEEEQDVIHEVHWTIVQALSKLEE